MSSPDTATAQTNPPADPQIVDINALVQKFRPQINQVLALDYPAQIQRFAEYGLTEEGIRIHYKDLFDKDSELQQRNKLASRNAMIVGGVSGLATLGAILIPFRKKSLRTWFSGNPLVQWTLTTIATFTLGLFGTVAGFHIFTSNIREEGKVLAQETRAEFEKMLALAMEKKEREAESTAPQAVPAVEQPAPETAPPAAAPAASKVSPRPPAQQRDSSYMAQSSKDKPSAGASQSLQ